MDNPLTWKQKDELDPWHTQLEQAVNIKLLHFQTDPHLETFRSFEKAGKTVLWDMHLSFVHELQQRGHVAGGGAIQDHQDARAYWSCFKQILEVFTASC